MNLRVGYVFLSLGIIALLIIVFVPHKSQQPIKEDIGSEFKEIAWTSHLETVKKVGDNSFTAFVQFDLQEDCPFYEPDGASYRECLSEYVLTKQPNSEIEESCRKVVSDYGGVEAQNLYLSCLAYFLPRHTF